MKSIFNSHNILLKALLALALCLVSGTAWASTYYAYVDVSCNPAGAGTIYKAGTSEEATGKVVESKYEAQPSIELTAEAKDGYSFNRWEFIKSEETTNFSISDSKKTITITGNTAATSSSKAEKWGDAIAYYDILEYTITFDTNGGKESYSDVKYYITETVNLPTPTRDCYTFTGWKPSSQVGNWDNAVTYYGGTSLTGQYGTVTLVAQWEPISYDIIYQDDKSGTGTLSPTTYNIESTEVLPTLTKDGYTFKGWKPSSQVGNWDNAVTYDGGTSLTGQYGTVILVAQWTLNEYTITFDTNGGTLTTDTKTYHITDAPFDLPTPTRDGYTFVHWQTNTEVDGNWKANTTYDVPISGMWGDVTLVAQWEPISYDINYQDGKGGTGTLSPTTYNIESTEVLPTLTKDGYTFNGWKPSSSVGNWNSDETYSGGTTSLTGQYGAVTLVAQWEIIPYSIRYFDGEEITDPDLSPKSYTIESTDTLPVLSDNNDYTFYGWQPKENVGNWYAATQYKAGTSETSLEGMYGNVELNAVWIPVEYRISLNPYGGQFGDGETGTIEKKYNADGITIDENYINQLPQVNKDYYDFANWTVSSTDTRYAGWEGTAVANASVVGKRGDVELTAQWTPLTYTITLNLNGGTLSDGATDTDYKYNIEGNGDGNISNLPKVERTGYSFNGWKVTKTDEDSWWKGHTPSAGDNGMSVNGKWGNVTLEAQWEPIPGYIKISVSGLQKNDSAVFGVSYDSVTVVVSLDSSNASGLLVKIPDVGAGKNVTVTPKAWPKNYNGLTLTTPPEEKTVYFSNVRDNPVSYEFILGERNLNIFETSREF